MAKALFDSKAYGRKLSLALHLMEIDMRTAAKQIGCSPATVSRVSNGKSPDVENYLRIEKWLNARHETLAVRARAVAF